MDDDARCWALTASDPTRVKKMRCEPLTFQQLVARLTSAASLRPLAKVVGIQHLYQHAAVSSSRHAVTSGLQHLSFQPMLVNLPAPVPPDLNLLWSHVEDDEFVAAEGQAAAAEGQAAAAEGQAAAAEGQAAAGADTHEEEADMEEDSEEDSEEEDSRMDLPILEEDDMMPASTALTDLYINQTVAAQHTDGNFYMGRVFSWDMNCDRATVIFPDGDVAKGRLTNLRLL